MKSEITQKIEALFDVPVGSAYANDSETGVANAMEAVRAGAQHKRYDEWVW